MNNLPQDLTMRRPTEADAQTTNDLMIACDIAEYGEADSDVEDLVYDWTSINLEQDAWLVFTPDNNLVGYAAIYEDNNHFPFDFNVHPTYAGDGLRAYLLAQCEARAIAQLTEAGESQEGSTSTIISQVNEKGRHALAQAGFEPQKYHFRMQIESDSLPPAPTWPEGCTLRTIVAEQDDQRVYEFIQTAFAQPGRTPPSFENWRDYMMRPDHFEKDLWFLLFHGEELIGAALCYDYSEFGWVRQLGVASSWRGQGIGSALLRHTFRIFFQQGHQKVALGVDSTRPQAQSLYESVGMSCVRRFDDYYKNLATI
jgi:ribosomal protein S18 acetylase RimI-like enzyme